MTGTKTAESGFSRRGAAILVCLAAIAAVLTFFARPLRQYIRESLMQLRVLAGPS